MQTFQRSRSFYSVKTKFEKWANDTSSIKTGIPRSVLLKRESVTALDLHVLGTCYCKLFSSICTDL